MPKKRRVKVFKFETINGLKSSKKVEYGFAFFHQWGSDYQEFESGAGNYSTAIIERDNGTVENVPVYLIKFINPIHKSGGE